MRIKTTCNRDCPDACGIVATVEDGRVTRLRGDPDHPVTRGFLCYRTNRFLERQYDPERLTEPLVREGGELRPASWDAALDRIARPAALAVHATRWGGHCGFLASPLGESWIDGRMAACFGGAGG